MAKRLFDIGFAVVGLIVAAPICAVAALGIALCSPGPILYRARRMGRNGVPFMMHKFRTMHAGVGGSAITSPGDPRVFWFGGVLRKLKIDEIPQLYDILIGRMSVVGPRPEDARIVEQHYDDAQRSVLSVPPGLTCPAMLFDYTHGHGYLAGDDTEDAYVQKLMPVVLALDQVYIRRASLWYDLVIMLRTASTILQRAAGRRHFPEPPELAEALAILERVPGLDPTAPAGEPGSASPVGGCGQPGSTHGRLTEAVD